MEPYQRQRISANFSTLTDLTDFYSLYNYLNNQKVFTARFEREVQGKAFQDLTNKQKNEVLYETIKTRGPNAFDILVEGLGATNHVNLAQRLNILYAGQIEEPQTPEPLLGYHYDYQPCAIFDCVSETREKEQRLLEKFFRDRGYCFAYSDSIEEDHESSSYFVVILNEGQNSVSYRKYLHKKFANALHIGKPKILLSFNYHPVPRVETDSIQNQSLFSDILFVQIFIYEKPGSSQDCVVTKFIEICDGHPDLDFVEQIDVLKKWYYQLGRKDVNISHELWDFKRYNLPKILSS